MRRKRLRMILLVVVPLIAAVAGLSFYLYGGRYIITDNAYVGAQKVLITPDISGKIVAHHRAAKASTSLPATAVRDRPGAVSAGAARRRRAKLAAVRTDFDNLKTNLGSLTKLVDLAQKNVELKQRDVDRKSRWSPSRPARRPTRYRDRRRW